MQIYSGSGGGLSMARRKSETPAQKAARERNFTLFQLEGIVANLQVILGKACVAESQHELTGALFNLRVVIGRIRG